MYRGSLIYAKAPDGTLSLDCALVPDARMYDPAVGRWLSPDPLTEKYYGISPYVFCGNNQVKYIDPQGDTILLSTTGYILKNNQQDNIVAVSFENGIKGVGSLGKEVDIYSIFSNLIDEYSSSAVLMNPFKLRGLVQNRGEWDLKNNKNTIYGLGNDGKTKFIFGEYPVMESQDVGNMHFGIVTKANIFISEDFALKKAGSAQISAGTSRPEWQIFKETVTWSGGYRTVIKTMLPPYGDDPRDHYWIKQGFNYYKNKE